MLVREFQTVDIPRNEIASAAGVMRVHVTGPERDGRYPGILFYSEIFQVTAPIRRTAAWLAGHGYRVAVPEVFHEFEAAGTVLPYTPAGTERGNAHKYGMELSSYDADAKAAVELLANDAHCNGRIGALGICLGGHLAYRAALLPQVRAAACFYATDLHASSLGKSKHDDSLARAAEIRGELMMVWGRQDPHIPAEGRAKIHDTLTKAGAAFTWHEFNAQHAFLRDEGHRYDPALASISQALMLELFARTLGG